MNQQNLNRILANIIAYLIVAIVILLLALATIKLGRLMYET